MTVMDASAPRPTPPGGRWSLLRRVQPAQARLWGVAGIHLAAFAVLYIGVFALIQRASAEAGATAARHQLDDAVRQMPFLWMGASSHAIPAMLASHRDIGLHLYRRDGSLVVAGNISPDPVELHQVRAFLQGSEHSASWLATEQGKQWVRGATRIQARAECAPCHLEGTTLGAATMKLDFTTPLAEIRDRLRTRMALLLAAWIALVGVITVLVQRAAQRAGMRLRADIAAASGGGAAELAAPPAVLPLDPVTAEVHRNLRELARRQRERETQVASRLARADQLASLGELAAGLAHEIKNPLAGIQGALELLREESGDPSTVTLYGEMLHELERVHGILQRLLESARPAPLRLARTDVGKLLQDTVDLLRPSLRRRRVEVGAELGPELPGAEIDGAKMRQVLVNLIQNAAEAMPESGGKVTVRATSLADEMASGAAASETDAAGIGSLVIAVEDDGPGIPAENLDRLFEPFFTTKFTGTGLGLPIVKSIVEQHRGHIEVSSESGRGTTFLLFLPAPAVAADADTDLHAASA
jgi:signal transduction histidine kinase